MNRLFRSLGRFSLAAIKTSLCVDNWVERVLVSAAVIAVAILIFVIAWGLIDGRYSLIAPF